MLFEGEGLVSTLATESILIYVSNPDNLTEYPPYSAPGYHDGNLLWESLKFIMSVHHYGF